MKRFFFSAAVLLAMTFGYLSGLIYVVNSSLWLGGILTVFLPLLVGFNYQRLTISHRVLQLLFIETSFNALVFIDILQSTYHFYLSSQALAYGYYGFFILQLMGFLLIQYQRRMWVGIVQSVIALLMISYWAFHSGFAATTITENGGIQFWGSDTSIFIKAYYCFWVISVLVVESRARPVARQAIMHFASLILALHSDEFFRIRLLTASHLFMLDILFGYSRYYGEKDMFAVLPQSINAYVEAQVLTPLSIICLVGCLACCLAFFL